MVNASIPEGIPEGLSGIAEGYFTKQPFGDGTGFYWLFGSERSEGSVELGSVELGQPNSTPHLK